MGWQFAFKEFYSKECFANGEFWNPSLYAHRYPDDVLDGKSLSQRLDEGKFVRSHSYYLMPLYNMVFYMILKLTHWCSVAYENYNELDSRDASKVILTISNYVRYRFPSKGLDAIHKDSNQNRKFNSFITKLDGLSDAELKNVYERLKIYKAFWTPFHNGPFGKRKENGGRNDEKNFKKIFLTNHCFHILAMASILTIVLTFISPPSSFFDIFRTQSEVFAPVQICPIKEGENSQRTLYLECMLYMNRYYVYIIFFLKYFLMIGIFCGLVEASYLSRMDNERVHVYTTRWLVGKWAANILVEMQLAHSDGIEDKIEHLDKKIRERENGDNIETSSSSSDDSDPKKTDEGNDSSEA